MNKTTEWNPFEHLKTPEEVTALLRELLQDDDPQLFINALGHLAKMRGMSAVAKAAGVNRESLYRSFSGNSNPHFETVYKVMRALDLQLAV